MIIVFSRFDVARLQAVMKAVFSLFLSFFFFFCLSLFVFCCCGCHFLQQLKVVLKITLLG